MDVGEHAIVLSTDPITGTADHIGRLASYYGQRYSFFRGELVGMMVTIILPENSTEEDLKEIMQELSECTARYGVEIMGGHTEVSAVVNRPLVSVTGVGKVKKGEIVATSGLKPGQDLGRDQVDRFGRKRHRGIGKRTGTKGKTSVRTG